MIDYRKLTTDYLLNLASVAVLGISGLLLNVIIARYYDSGVLGVFNQVFAIYIFASQVGTLGVQFSAIRFAAVHSQDPSALGATYWAGLGIVSLTSTAVTISVCLGRDEIGELLSSPDVAAGLVWALPGLWAFAINKYLLNILNGVQWQKAYAVFTGLRYFTMVAALAVATAVGSSGNRLPIIFSVAEITLAMVLLPYTMALGGTPPWTQVKNAMGEHLRFGLKSLPGGVFAELNTRVDVLVLGYFLGDRDVGIFSFAAIFAEGLLQVPLIMRRLVDPVISRLAVDERWKELEDLLVLVRNRTYIGVAILTLAAAAVFPLATTILTNNPDLQQGWPVFAILMLGCGLQGGYIAFTGLLAQSNHPGWQTLYLLLIVVTNVVLNVLLIPQYGIIGASLATAGSFVASALYLKWLVRRTLALRI